MLWTARASWARGLISWQPQTRKQERKNSCSLSAVQIVLFILNGGWTLVYRGRQSAVTSTELLEHRSGRSHAWSSGVNAVKCCQSCKSQSNLWHSVCGSNHSCKWLLCLCTTVVLDVLQIIFVSCKNAKVGKKSPLESTARPSHPPPPPQS